MSGCVVLAVKLRQKVLIAAESRWQPASRKNLTSDDPKFGIRANQNGFSPMNEGKSGCTSNVYHINGEGVRIPQLRIGLNKIALLEKSRGSGHPSISKAAQFLLDAGAKALLVHVWPDGRHVMPEDLRMIADLPMIRSGEASLSVGSNLHPELLNVIKHTPNIANWIVTPFRQEDRTTMHGWYMSDLNELQTAIAALSGGVGISLFIDPDPSAIQLANIVGAIGVELNCRGFVNAAGVERELELAKLEQSIKIARAANLVVSLAHDLSAADLQVLCHRLRPDFYTVGHCFIADAILSGLATTFQSYAAIIRLASLPTPPSED